MKSRFPLFCAVLASSRAPSRSRNWLAAGLLVVAACLLGGCSTLSGWLGFNSQAVLVQQVAAARDCRANIDHDTVRVLETASAVGKLELQRDFRLQFPRTLPDGPFALLEIAPEADAAQSVAVSRQAFVHRGTLYVTATYLPAAHKPPQATPCVLIALPAKSWDTITVLDPAHTVRASASRKQ